MWNKRRDEEPVRPYAPATPSAPPAVPSYAEPKKETTTMSMPSGRYEPEARGSQATIGKAVKIVGEIQSKEDLYVDGDVEGTVISPDHRLTVGPNGTLHATVKAREILVLGSIQGNVEAADRIEIRKEAKLVGDIRTARIVIEDGAYFKGSIDIVKPEPAKVSGKPQGQPAVAPAPVSATAGAPDIKR